LLAVVVAMYEAPVARTMPVGILRYSLVDAAAFTTIEGCVVPSVTEVASYILRYVTDELAVLSNSRWKIVAPPVVGLATTELVTAVSVRTLLPSAPDITVSAAAIYNLT
jgi:hypothetical protein